MNNKVAAHVLANSMSDKYARNSKPELRAGTKPRFQSHNTSTFKTKYSLDQGRPSAALPKPGLSSLGKVPIARRIPKPHIESKRSENFGEDPDVQLVPRDGSGWGGGKAEVSDLDSNQDQRRRDHHPQQHSQSSSSGARTWSEQASGIRVRNAHLVPNEFPSLGSEGSGRSGGGPEDALSLKPASRASWRQGASGNFDADDRPLQHQRGDAHPGGTRVSKEFLDYPDMKPAYMKQQQNPGGNYGARGNPIVTAPSILTKPRPNREEEWKEPPVSVPKDGGRELDKIAELDKDVEGWAGATGEVDYNKKIVFSDDEDGGPSSDKTSGPNEKKTSSEARRRPNPDFFRGE
jgi:hypothetical protein